MSQTQDFYGHRLASLNETNTVVANEDIYNSDGTLLLAKGNTYSQKRASTIAKHKLIKPLEQSIAIETTIDAAKLFGQMMKFCRSLPGVEVITRSEIVQSSLERECQYYSEFPLLRQKLTVLADTLPEIYYNSLFSAIVGTVLAIDLKLGEDDRHAAFVGGLMHNTGFLHLDPEITADERQLDRNISSAVQAHPLIAKHFLDHVPGLPKSVGEAVGDHHERTDGTGYPGHKFGVQLSLASQVIAFTDVIVDAYQRCLPYGDHAHHLMLLVVQFNSNVHFEEVYNSAVKLIRQGPVPETPPPNIPPPPKLMEQLDKLLSVFEADKKLAFLLMKNTRSRLTKSIASMLGRLATTIVSAGIAQPQYREWLEELATQRDHGEELALVKSKVSLDEIQLQLDHFKSIMWLTIQKHPPDDKDLHTGLLQSFEQIDKM